MDTATGAHDVYGRCKGEQLCNTEKADRDKTQ